MDNENNNDENNNNESINEKSNSTEEEPSGFSEFLLLIFAPCEFIAVFFSLGGYLLYVSRDSIVHALSQNSFKNYFNGLFGSLVLNFIPIIITTVQYFLGKRRFRMYLAMVIFSYFSIACMIYFLDWSIEV